MDLTHLEHDLFLLMLNLSQLNNSDLVLRLFLDAMNDLGGSFRLSLHQGEKPQVSEALEIATLVHSFGWINVEGDFSSLSAADVALVRNAVRMLAVILENRWQAHLLADENLRLENAITQRTRELITINNRLQEEIQERQQVENALRASERRLKSIVENMPVLMDAFDAEGHLVAWNRACEQVTGYQGVEAMNDPLFLEKLYPDARQRQTVLSRILSQQDYQEQATPLVCKDGQQRFIAWYSMSKSFPIAGWSTWAIGVDVTEQTRILQALRASVEEKEVLLREIHHRVKNNLQVMISLLALQADHFQDAALLEAIQESQNRLRSMALVHEELYHSENLAEVDFSSYVSRLVGTLASAYRVNQVIDFCVDVPEIRLNVDVAIPCGLMISELVSNACKYAFPDDRAGTVWVSMQPTGNGYWCLRVQDNGIGLPAGLNVEHPSTMGLQLVNILTAQINGVLQVQREPGAAFTITYPCSKI